MFEIMKKWLVNIFISVEFIFWKIFVIYTIYFIYSNSMSIGAKVFMTIFVLIFFKISLKNFKNKILFLKKINSKHVMSLDTKISYSIIIFLLLSSYICFEIITNKIVYYLPVKLIFLMILYKLISDKIIVVSFDEKK